MEWLEWRWNLPQELKAVEAENRLLLDQRNAQEQRIGGLIAKVVLGKARVIELERQIVRQAALDALPGLTPAEIERLAILAEECGEVVQAVGKVLRHGWESQSPYGGKPNRQALEREIGNVRAVVNLMLDSGDVRLAELQAWQRRKREQVEKWTHHQNCSMPREEQVEMMRAIELKRLGRQS